jgi:hypothetical protein
MYFFENKIGWHLVYAVLQSLLYTHPKRLLQYLARQLTSSSFNTTFLHESKKPFNPLNLSKHGLCHTYFLHFAHTLCLCVSYVSQNKQPLLTSTSGSCNGESGLFSLWYEISFFKYSLHKFELQRVQEQILLCMSPPTPPPL